MLWATNPQPMENRKFEYFANTDSAEWFGFSGVGLELFGQLLYLFLKSNGGGNDIVNAYNELLEMDRGKFFITRVETLRGMPPFKYKGIRHELFGVMLNRVVANGLITSLHTYKKFSDFLGEAAELDMLLREYAVQKMKNGG